MFAQNGLGFCKGFWDKEPVGSRIDLRLESAQIAPNAIQIRLSATPETETQFGLPDAGAGLGLVVHRYPYFRGGTVRLEFADGTTKEFAYPLPRDGYKQVKTVAVRSAEGEESRLVCDPPVFVHADVDEIRLFPAPTGPTAGGATMTQAVTLELPTAARFEPDNRWVDTSDWLVYEHQNDFAPGSVIGMEDWLHRPAGKHGWMQIDGEKLRFADGTPAKLFGTGASWGRFLVSEEKAAQWADKLAKHGINVIRLIPMAGHGHQGVMQADDHCPLDPALVELFDNIHAAMRERGVYVGWSPQYHTVLTPADRDRVWDYDELMKGAPDGDVTYNVFNIAPDLQNLMIQQTLALLTHTNRHTGLRYADDPAIPWIEMRNENDIFFNFDNFGAVEKNFPGYFKKFQERYNDFLQEKYKSQEALEQAWGSHYPQGQTLAARDIRPQYIHWGFKEIAPPPVADTMHFMYLEQRAFYERYAKAIRETGYQGALDGSCWQAASLQGHLLNLLTDFEVGIIDRHNYGPTPLDNPGVGNMSFGFQQVKGRPFNASEWGGGPVDVPTLAIYGLGLQGWDISCQYASNASDIFNKRIRDCNNSSDDFIQISQMPALARMVYRGDVQEGNSVATRRVGIPDLLAGKVGFYEHFSLLGGANNKEFSAVVPSAALMAGRVLIEFVDGPTPEPAVIEEVSKYNDPKAQIVRSNTGQLFWDYSGRGYYTVNTPGSQAVIGHVAGRSIDLADVTLETDSSAPVKLYVTALDKEATIKTGQRLLITALGRDANTGMKFDEFNVEHPVIEGNEPLLIEPLTVNVTLKRGGVKSVRPLDHSGRLREGAQLLPVKDGKAFTLDGKDSKTMYYLVECE